MHLTPPYGLPQKLTAQQEGMKDKYESMDVDHHAFPDSAHHTKLVAHGGIGKFGRGFYNQHHLDKHSLTTSGPEVHKRKSNEDPAYNTQTGVGEMMMYKRWRRYANKEADASKVSDMEMMFMGIGGKEIINLELLKREEQYLLAWQMIRHHQQN